MCNNPEMLRLLRDELRGALQARRGAGAGLWRRPAIAGLIVLPVLAVLAIVAT